jgi:hypothetical protein
MQPSKIVAENRSFTASWLETAFSYVESQAHNIYGSNKVKLNERPGFATNESKAGEQKQTQ